MGDQWGTVEGQGFEIEPGASTRSRDPQAKPHKRFLETDLLPAQDHCGEI
jgi:hypothetical protein